VKLPARYALYAAAALLPGVAYAHTHAGATTGFASGFLHPLTGIDHLLAMMAVGMWGAELGGAAIWVLPVAFPFVMALGGVAGILGLPMLAIEPGIAFSVIMLGLVIAVNMRVPLAFAGVLVSTFAIFHGYAHGAELPAQASALTYCMGFVIATGLIHLSGIAIGLATKLPHGLSFVRFAGGAICCAGILIAFHVIVP
jgi:urease accessory protein